ncbi:MAG: sigma-70 family RNA polymerase sigma factor [Oscillospiraceae bacterium]
MSHTPSENDSKSPEKAPDCLMTAYMPYIQKTISRITVSGLEQDDLVQEGLVGLFKAFETYDDSKGTQFSTYAITCIDNNIKTAIKQANRKKHLPLRGYLSLSGDECGGAFANLCSPEDRAIASEEYDAVINKINSELSNLERDVLGLYLKGYDYLAVAKKLDTTPKSVDNALQRARKKLKSKQ